MTECAHCEYFDLSANKCILSGDKGYDNGTCLHENCKFFEEGKWVAMGNEGMNLVYDDEAGTWGIAPEPYATIEVNSKEEFEYIREACKHYRDYEARHWEECRQIAHYEDENREMKKLLKSIFTLMDVECLAEQGGVELVEKAVEICKKFHIEDGDW